MKKLIVNLFLKAFGSRTTQNVGLAVVITQLLLDLGERYLPDVPWQGSVAELVTYIVGILVAAIGTAAVGRVAAEVREPGKLGR